MQPTKNKQILATIIAIILVTSMATMLIPQSNVTAEVINGVNYNQATADAIHAGMHWDLNANASTIRLTLWNRYHDAIPTWVFSTITPNPVGVEPRIHHDHIQPTSSIPSTRHQRHPIQIPRSSHQARWNNRNYANI